VNIDETQTLAYSVFPNPAHNRIFMHQLASGSAVEIVSITGESVYNGIYRADGIDITPLAAGNYVIRESESGSVIRFVKL
jgi:hypothetical protein